MGLTRCYKTTVCYIYICSFFLLNLYYRCTGQLAVLRCCKNERKPYWNTTYTLVQNDSFLHLYLQFFYYIYFTDAHYCTCLYTVLRCCKNERKPYWNSTCGFNLVIFVINTSFADAKSLLLLTCPIQLENCIGIYLKDYGANSYCTIYCIVIQLKMNK